LNINFITRLSGKKVYNFAEVLLFCFPFLFCFLLHFQVSPFSDIIKSFDIKNVKSLFSLETSVMIYQTISSENSISYNKKNRSQDFIIYITKEQSCS